MAAPSRYPENSPTALVPATRVAAVVTDDAAELAFKPTAVYVGTAGNLTVIMNGVTALFKNVPAGTTLRIRPDVINATGTTAADILILD